MAAMAAYRAVVGFAVAATLVLAACGGDNGGSESKPGSQAVYDRIDAMTSCPELQSQFDTAMDNVDRYPAGSTQREAPLAYAKYADARMKKVGCY